MPASSADGSRVFAMTSEGAILRRADLRRRSAPRRPPSRRTSASSRWSWHPARHHRQRHPRRRHRHAGAAPDPGRRGAASGRRRAQPGRAHDTTRGCRVTRWWRWPTPRHALDDRQHHRRRRRRGHGLARDSRPRVAGGRATRPPTRRSGQEPAGIGTSGARDPLSREVKLLGALLGQVIAEQAGEGAAALGRARPQADQRHPGIGLGRHASAGCAPSSRSSPTIRSRTSSGPSASTSTSPTWPRRSIASGACASARARRLRVAPRAPSTRPCGVCFVRTPEADPGPP